MERMKGVERKREIIYKNPIIVKADCEKCVCVYVSVCQCLSVCSLYSLGTTNNDASVGI